MVDSFLDGSVMPGSILTPKVYRRSKFQDKRGWMSSLLITILFIGIATISAPEKPYQLASICERHNSALACRVW